MARSRSSSPFPVLFLVLFVLIFCVSQNGVAAFGAGNIPSFAYVEGRAFRHGDIEDTLADLVKKGAAGGIGGLAGKLVGRSKFGGLDIKRVYFGNWLRDYSQAVDVASLKKLPLQSIINLCMVLGFLAHGYATNEFEVTEQRLGVYLPVEHIDNPKGYGEGEDARKYNPKLRGPVDPRELEVDPRTGMKNYIANEHGGWDTSKAHVRRVLEKCIALGRQHRHSEQKQDLYEAYRLLGTALHTLEDFPAHSNFCELALVSMGHQHVFVHVGDNVRIQAPNGRWVAPIITGSFGGSDFLHSLLGEASDHLSQASVSDLNKEMNKAHNKSRSEASSGTSPSSVLRDLFSGIPGGGGDEMTREMDGVERIRAQGQGQAPGKRPEDMSPQELHAVLWNVLSFRDSIAKKIEKTIERIPGLGALIEKIMDSISVFIFTTLEPYVAPLIKTATSGLMSASSEVIDSHDQYEVFNDPRASDPTHSFLSKDHFNLILNEPAGLIAKVIVTYTVNAVTKAWDDPSVNVHHLCEDVLQCLFHPDFTNNSPIQHQMLQCLHSWASGLGHKQHKILDRLSKENVRNHNNIRFAGEGGAANTEGTYAQQQGQQVQSNIQNYLQGVPGVGQAQSFLNQFGGSGGGGPGHRRDVSGGSGGGDYPQPQQYSAPSHGGYAPSYGGPPPQGGGYANPEFPQAEPGGAGGFAPPPGGGDGGYGGQGFGFPQPEPGGFAAPPPEGYPGQQPHGHHGHHGHHGGPPPGW